MCSPYTRKREFVFVEALAPVQRDPVISDGLEHPPCPVAGRIPVGPQAGTSLIAV